MGATQPGNASEADSKGSTPAQELVADQQKDHAAPKVDVVEDIFAIRQPRRDDLGFIFQTFIEGMFSGNAWIPEHISKENFWRLYRNALDGLFQLPGVGCWVLCLRDDPDTIIGYLVLSQNAIHWVHVKKAFQGFGLAKRLLAHAGVTRDGLVTVSHLTDEARKHLPEKWDFKPFLLF